MVSYFKCDSCGNHPKCKQEQLDQPFPQHRLRHNRGFHHIFRKRRLILNKYTSKGIILYSRLYWPWQALCSNLYHDCYKCRFTLYLNLKLKVHIKNNARIFNRSDTCSNSCEYAIAAKHIQPNGARRSQCNSVPSRNNKSVLSRFLLIQSIWTRK